MKVFVTGPTASGKTTLARAMAESGGVYVDYDRSYRPAPISDPMPQTMNPPSARRFLDLLQDGCVVDNVVYDPALTTFNRWAAENGGVRICVVVPEYQEWLKRRPAGAHETSPALWSYYWGKLFSGLDMPVEYVDSDGQVLSFANAAERIGMKSIIRGLMAVKDHDNRYQDIPEIGHIGYSGSRDSWLRIAPLVDWSDASVVDCGSFYGYMLFRIRDAGCSGGRLIGMDFLAAHLNISRLVNRLRGDNVEFRQWNAGEKVPQADVTLCLNALHHFPDSSQPLGVHNTVKCPTQKFYDSIESPVTIFEAYTRYEPELRQNWDIVETFQSGREGRAIYRCKR